MALRVLMLRKKADEKKTALTELRTKGAGFAVREVELGKSIDEAQTAEEKQAVEDAIAAFEKELAENSAAIADLEQEVTTMEKDIKELEDSTPPAQEDPEKRGGREPMRRTTRDARLAYLARSEVKEFYTRMADAVRDKRSLSNVSLTIPEAVVDMIQTKIGDYGTLYQEVNVLTLNGTLRAIIDGAVPEGVWVEMTGALTELAASFKPVEADGFKVGGYVPVSNSVLEDSMINLASYIETRIAQAISKALDKAILKGTGPTGKQPLGIIPSLHNDNKPAAFVYNVGKIMEHVGDIDDGENSVGEIIAVMKRSTYYKQVVPNTVTFTADGKQVVQSVASPTLAGVRVVFNNNMDKNAVLLGDYKKYLLAERAGVEILSSTDVKFIEDQTVFKGTARYDGKPTNLDEDGKTKDWVLVTLLDAPPPKA